VQTSCRCFIILRLAQPPVARFIASPRPVPRPPLRTGLFLFPAGTHGSASPETGATLSRACYAVSTVPPFVRMRKREPAGFSGGPTFAVGDSPAVSGPALALPQDARRGAVWRALIVRIIKLLKSGPTRGVSPDDTHRAQATAGPSGMAEPKREELRGKNTLPLTETGLQFFPVRSTYCYS
jgi:hypothetical protein